MQPAAAMRRFLVAATSRALPKSIVPLSARHPALPRAIEFRRGCAATPQNTSVRRYVRSGRVRTITLEGDANGAPHPEASAYAKMFSGKYAHRLIKGGIGHNLPQEAPQAFADAVVEVDAHS